MHCIDWFFALLLFVSSIHTIAAAPIGEAVNVNHVLDTLNDHTQRLAALEFAVANLQSTTRSLSPLQRRPEVRRSPRSDHSHQHPPTVPVSDTTM